MSAAQLIFFAAWLAVAAVGGLTVVAVWEWLRKRSAGSRDGRGRSSEGDPA